MSKTKFAIGCLVQWYECDIINEYIETLKEAIDQYDGEVIVDINIITDETLEKCISREQYDKCILKISSIIGTPVPKNWNVNVIGYLHTIADYRREFNESYCDTADVLIWGESDMLVPKQMFRVLDLLHQNVNTPKYIATFGICKMWDDTWKPLEHPEFTDKPFITGDTKNWWSIPYTMTKDEMNSFNDKIEPLEVTQITPHKFNGCGLVISSEVIRSGVNIPKSVFFVHEDTAFMLMIRKVLGDIPQYHIRNILVVHNRKHPNKRMYVQGEQIYENNDIDAKRKLHAWYSKANKLCSDNCYNLFNANFKSYTWQDVWN
jgi:hypothetical protein